jgi:AhpC/TSA family
MIRKLFSLTFLLAAASIAAAQSGNPPPSPAKPPTPPPASMPPAGVAPQAPSTTAPPQVPHTTLKVGDAAPDFNLPSTIVGADGKTVRYKLSDFKGKKNVVLAFYVLAFTGG